MNKFLDAIGFMICGALLLYLAFMGTHNCYLLKSDGMTCVRHAFDFWSIFAK